MKHRTKKILFRFIFLPVIALVVLIVIGTAVLYSQQQRLVGLAVEELNKQLPGKLAIGGSDISVFQNFPYISIGLKNVQFYASKAATGKPIYEVERMYIGFSLPDLLKQQYRVKAIVLKNGHLDLVQDKDGKLNIVEASRISMESTTSQSSTSPPLDLAIKKVVLKNIDLSFLDKESGQQVVSHIDRIQSSLRADSVKITADLQGQLLVDYTHPGDTTLFRHKHLQTTIQFSYNKSTQLLQLKDIIPMGRSIPCGLRSCAS